MRFEEVLHEAEASIRDSAGNRSAVVILDNPELSLEDIAKKLSDSNLPCHAKGFLLDVAQEALRPISEKIVDSKDSLHRLTQYGVIKAAETMAEMTRMGWFTKRYLYGSQRKGRIGVVYIMTMDRAA